MKKFFTLLVLVAMTLVIYSQAPQKMSYQAVIRNSSGQLVTNHAVGMKISILQGSATGTPVYVETQNPTTNSNGLSTVEIGGGNVVSGTFAGINWSSGIYFIKTETDPAGGVNYTITGTSQILSVPYALYARTAGNGSLWSPSGSNIYFNSGNIGIGTSTPVTFIHAHGSPVTSRGQLSLSAPAGKDIFLSFYEDNTFKSYLWFNVADQDLRLQNFTAGDLNLNPYGGKVGIGTITPGATLEVAGTVKFTGKLDMQNQNISNLADPVNKQDASTKGYVDKLTEDMDNLLLLSGQYGSMTDADGNTYKTVQIGSQVWMAENLKVTKYRNGTAITNVTGNSAWSALSSGAYCWYDNNSSANKDTYGALYNWHAVSSGTLCPTGWHVPTRDDWNSLFSSYSLNGLAEAGTAHWQSGLLTSAATNKYGFTALPGGFRKSDGTFDKIGYNGTWWASTEYNTLQSYRANLSYEGTISLNYAGKTEGQSIRCISDTGPAATFGGSDIHKIGEYYGGGIVFYIYDDGRHGLIAAKTDLSTGIRWYAGTFINTMARSNAGGRANTSIIVASLGYGDGSTYAARICIEKGSLSDNDWYLPSKWELDRLYGLRNVVGGFANADYWSSTEDGPWNAWSQNFGTGTPGSSSKTSNFYVRPIRAF